MRTSSGRRGGTAGVISTEKLGSGISRVVIDSPPANQLDRAGRQELLGTLADLADPDLRVAILIGANGRFSAGNEIEELRDLAPDRRWALSNEWDEIYRALDELPVPVIAAIDGYAFGGGFELMLSCDLRLVTADARLACTAAKLGVVTSTFSLGRTIGGPLGRELFYTSRILTAEEALQHGIVNGIVDAGRLDDEALALARRIAAQPALAIRRSKNLLSAAQLMDRAEHDRIQAEAFVELAATEDHARAVALFLEDEFVQGEGEPET